MSNDSRPGFALSVRRTGVGVNVFCDVPSVWTQCLNGSQNYFAPGFKIHPEPVESKYEIWIFEQDHVNVYHDMENCRIVLRGPMKCFGKGETIPYLAYGLLELAGAESRQLTMHGAVVTKGNGALVLLGKEGAGKTSMAMKLCLDHNFSVMANDLFIISVEQGVLHALAGTDHFFIRGSSISTHFPQFVPLIREHLKPDYTLRQIRCSILPESINISINREPKRILSGAFLQIDDKASAISIQPLALSQRLFIHENLTRYIRKTALPTICGESGMIYNPSYDRLEFHDLRASIISTLCTGTGLKKIYGPLDEVAELLAGDFECHQ